jgi:hypothetical protein
VPAVPPAVEQLVASPLPLTDWVELPPAPPVTELVAPPEFPALLVQAPLPLAWQLADPSLSASASDQASPPLLSYFCFCLTDPSDELSLSAELPDEAHEFPDVEDCEPLPEPLLDAELLLVVSPPVATALLLLDEVALVSALWEELPPAPPVALLDAAPEFPALAVEAPLPLLLEVLSPSLSA